MNESKLSGAASPAISRQDIAIWAPPVVLVLIFIVAIKDGLLPGILAGLLVHQAVHVLTPHISRSQNISSKAARHVILWVLVALIVAAIVSAVVFISNMLLGMSGEGGVTQVMNHMARILNDTRDLLPAWASSAIPQNLESLKEQGIHWLREHSAQLGAAGSHVGAGLVHLAFGLIIGSMLVMQAPPSASWRAQFPAASQMLHEIEQLALFFRRVVFAQFWISAINTSITALWILAVLPMFDIQLPFAKTLIVWTFVAGFIPILGNLVSNTFIVVTSLSVSMNAAIGSLAFLVIIHKVEYFLNARIVGGQLKAAAWEILLAIITMERLAGIPGVVVAPFLYAYIKNVLVERKIIGG